MTDFQRFLHTYTPPGFVLLKNAQTKFVAALGFQVHSFDEAIWSDSFSELLQTIPTPTLLNNKEAKELAGWRFSENEIAAGNFKFDTLPESLVSESGDLKLFGESYTIFWIAEPNEDWVIDAILRRFETSNNAPIDASLIQRNWNETINRIFFMKREETALDLHVLYEELIENLIARINALPNAPAPEAWEILNEDPFWDEA
jgi:hypothetical protein